jgi:hypothetical protein
MVSDQLRQGKAREGDASDTTGKCLKRLELVFIPPEIDEVCFQFFEM